MDISIEEDFCCWCPKTLRNVIHNFFPFHSNLWLNCFHFIYWLWIYRFTRFHSLFWNNVQMGWRKLIHSNIVEKRPEQRGRERNCGMDKKEKPSFDHKRQYSTVAISNMHSEVAGTVQLNECCGQTMKGLNSTTFSSAMPQHNQNPFRWCQSANLFFGRIPFFTSNPDEFHQCYYLSMLASVALILYTLMDKNPFHYFYNSIFTYLLNTHCNRDFSNLL